MGKGTGLTQRRETLSCSDQASGLELHNGRLATHEQKNRALNLGCMLDLKWMQSIGLDSHGGLEVTIRQTESKKKLPNNFVKQTPECS